MPIAPSSLVHVVYRTRRFEMMLSGPALQRALAAPEPARVSN